MDTDQEKKGISEHLDTLTIEPNPVPAPAPAPKKIVLSDVRRMPTALGTGSYSNVYLAIYDEKKIALKKYKNSETDPTLEAGAHGNLDHINIVKLIGYIQENTYSALVLEYCNENDLLHYLENAEVSDTKPEREKIALDIAQGLVYLHEFCRIIHGDIKLENILLHSKNKGITAKITDFGFAKQLKPDETSYTGTAAGTPAYACPEHLNESPHKGYTYSFPADIFAFGHIIHLLTQSDMTNPLPGFKTVYKVLSFIKDGHVSNMPLFETYSTATTRTLIRSCHMTDPENRITAQKIVKQFESGHTLFQSPKME